MQGDKRWYFAVRIWEYNEQPRFLPGEYELYVDVLEAARKVRTLPSVCRTMIVMVTEVEYKEWKRPRKASSE